MTTNRTLHTSSVLLVDDEPPLLRTLSIMLESSGCGKPEICEDSRQVMQILKEKNIELIVLDLLMPHIKGNELLPQIIKEYPHIPVIILTAVNGLEMAVECMKAGASDYLTKPIDKYRFVATVKKTLDLKMLERENLSLREHLLTGKLENPDAFKKIVTSNSIMRSIFQYVESIAKTNRTVLITGETGVGKELIAKAVFENSGSTGKFVSVNASGLDDTIFADTLFGHQKGAYTGAADNRDGLIVQAAHGILFLDEIGDLTDASQIKLLRLLQENEYYPLGSDIPKKSFARIIAATHHDIGKLVSHGKFRKDLYFRLNAHKVEIPPLRERINDLPLLMEYFLDEASRELEVKKPTLPSELIIQLSNYNFPGNLRELQGMIYEALSRHEKGILSMQSFHKLFKNNIENYTLLPENKSSDHTDKPHPPMALASFFNGKIPTIKEVERLLIQEAMTATENNQSMAARILGISRHTLINRLKQP